MYALAVVLASGYGSRSGSASWSASWSGSWSWSASSESVEGAGEACQRQLSNARGGGAERVLAGVRVRGSKPRGGGRGRGRAEVEQAEKVEGGAVLYARGVKSAEKVHVMEDIGVGAGVKERG